MLIVPDLLASRLAPANPNGMMHLYNDEMQNVVPAALKRLLCEKHLYQGIEVDLRPLLAVSERIAMEQSSPGSSGYGASPPSTVKELAESDESCAKMPWVIDNCEAQGLDAELLTVRFDLPSINTYCDACRSRPPYNPIVRQSITVVDRRSPVNQWYNLAFECQQCKGMPVRFLVRREGLKLRLCGRDPIEAVPVPSFLPKAQSKFYSDAQIAHHAGQTLAGIFLLRTFVEQFWRTLPEVQELLKKQPRATGEEQGAIYQDTLSKEFKERFPSVSDIYGKLSAAMHQGDANAALFEESCQKVEKHFDARRIFEL
jgi:hypothetical protein